MKVLHIVPSSVADPAMRFHGSTKDVACRVEYFRARGAAVTRMVVERGEESISAAASRADLAGYDVVLLDVPKSYPRALETLRARCGRARLLFRSINADFLHRVDLARASDFFWQKRGFLRKAFSALWKDVRALRRADGVLAITDADGTYWDRLGAAGKVSVAPFFLAEEYLEPAAPPAEKTDECVCLTAVVMNPLIVDASRRFARLVGRLGDARPEWTFSVTGEVAHDMPSRVKRLGLLASPREALRRARAVALLSDFGRGFKTKILDAALSRAYVLVTPGLHRRLPPEVLPFCFPVRPESADDFARALDLCRAPFPAGDPNAALRDRSFRSMDAALGAV
jgi:hypothetical protein